MVAWTAEAYKEVLNGRKSPKSLGAARREELLLLDFASADLAFTKVRVAIAEKNFVDYLTWQLIDGKWLITSKGFHLESVEPNRTW